MLNLALLAILFAATSGTNDVDAVLGTWEGESLCTVPDSPCKDEHVIYEFKRDGDTKLALDGYKVVKGEKQFMGTLSCKLPQNGELSCTIPNARSINEWLFKIDGKRMTGTLYMDKERSMFRRIGVEKR
jgi:hypothetical protein